MPYAYGATITHTFETDHIELLLTFKHPMNQDNTPDEGLWTLTCDSSEIDITNSDWIDEFTLKLTSDTVSERPQIVTLAYAGPSSALKTTWGKQWEPFGDTPSTDENWYEEPSFVDRGDPADWDFETGDLTLDDNWNDLDLSSIVPEGATAVSLVLQVGGNVSSGYLLLRKNGNSNNKNAPTVRIQVDGILVCATLLVAIDADRKIEYQALSGISSVKICVSAWFQ